MNKGEKYESNLEDTKARCRKPNSNSILIPEKDD